MLKILVADDDLNIRNIILHYLEKQCMNVLHADNGKAALELVINEKPDLVVLDLLMPEMDGYDVCREIRRRSETPIIMLTASGDEFDRVLGLELGADDYMTKPFSPRELVARIKAILRRAEGTQQCYHPPSQQAATYDYGQILIDINRREVVVKGQKIALRPKEFDLLVYLAKNPGNVYTREVLLEQVWGYDFLGDIRTVDTHIKKIRAKLEKVNCEAIHTVWGVGYKFEAP
ncbi:response regulator transcription factor [Alkalihalobacillus oceani]|uniref:Response regulator transcription factor n=2 Tax=Halalkalibacter oceani TaxID=1653776 RepID=A0A9X2INU9_9BACI|nr:response regulator transcription factor [Halalkalibacter oceani]MCM3713752.1 response regulator transcription factor [Halalkalibacter oceani]